MFGDKSLPGLTHCHLFHKHPFYMAWDDGCLGLVSILHLYCGAQQAGCWPSPFGSALAARTPATGSHPATCAALLTDFLSVPSNPLAFSRISRALIPAGVPPPQTLLSALSSAICSWHFPQSVPRDSHSGFTLGETQIWIPEGGASEQTNLLSSNPSCPVAQNRCFLHQLSSIH